MFRKNTPYLYLAVPMALMLAFFFIPLIMAGQISLLDYSNDLYTPDFVGLKNYETLFASPAFWNAMRNTFTFLVAAVPAMVVIPILLALLVNGNLKGIQLFRALIYLPVVISMVVVGITWKWLLADDGLINYFLVSMGFQKVGWLVNPDVALFAIALVVVWKGVAYYMMMYLAHLQSLSKDLYEAADIDGASFWQKHLNVTIPHLQPTMVMVAIISTIGSLKIFTEIYVMTRGGPVGSTQTLVYYIYSRAFENLDLGVASAAGLVLMVILIAMSIVEMQFSGKEDKSPPVKPAPVAAVPTAPAPDGKKIPVLTTPESV